MRDASIGLICEIAQNNHVNLKSRQIECLLLVYALVFKEACKMLDGKVVSKIFIEKIENAFDEIHRELGYLKVKIDELERSYSDIETISPKLEKALSHLRAMLEVCDLTKPDPRQRPEKLRLRQEALRLYNEDLLACRRYVTEITYQVEWWCEEEDAKDCRSAG